MVRLIFVHIPKTGGQSVGRLLNKVGRNFNPFSILGKRPENCPELGDPDGVDELARLFRERIGQIPEDVEVLQDWMPVQFFDGIYDGVPRVTVLRDPVQRVWSAYHHFKKLGLVNADIRLEEFVALPTQSDMQWKMTGGDLSKFDLVGDTDNLQDFSAKLSKRLGEDLGEVPHVNSGEYGEPNKDQVALIRNHNQRDIELYRAFVHPDAEYFIQIRDDFLPGRFKVVEVGAPSSAWLAKLMLNKRGITTWNTINSEPLSVSLNDDRYRPGEKLQKASVLISHEDVTEEVLKAVDPKYVIAPQHSLPSPLFDIMLFDYGYGYFEIE